MPAKPKKDLPQGGSKVKARGKRCPICGKPASPESLPFCSPRCRDVDLNRWLSGSYVVPGSENDDEDAE